MAVTDKETKKNINELLANRTILTPAIMKKPESLNTNTEKTIPSDSSPNHYVTLLMAASSKDEETALTKLHQQIKPGDEVNCFNIYGKTPLAIAIENFNFKIAKFLICRGARWDLKGNASKLCYYPKSASTVYRDLKEQALKTHVEEINKQQMQQLNIVEILSEYFPEALTQYLNNQLEDRTLSFYYDSASNQILDKKIQQKKIEWRSLYDLDLITRPSANITNEQFYQLLLSSLGGNVEEIINEQYYQLLLVSVKENPEEIVNKQYYQLLNKQYYQLLLASVKEKPEDIVLVKYLLDHNTSGNENLLNTVFFDGETLLTKAVKVKNFEIARYLTNRGAKWNLKDNNRAQNSKTAFEIFQQLTSSNNIQQHTQKITAAHHQEIEIQSTKEILSQYSEHLLKKYQKGEFTEEQFQQNFPQISQQILNEKLRPLNETVAYLTDLYYLVAIAEPPCNADDKEITRIKIEFNDRKYNFLERAITEKPENTTLVTYLLKHGEPINFSTAEGIALLRLAEENQHGDILTLLNSGAVAKQPLKPNDSHQQAPVNDKKEKLSIASPKKTVKQEKEFAQPHNQLKHGSNPAGLNHENNDPNLNELKFFSSATKYARSGTKRKEGPAFSSPLPPLKCANSSAQRG